MLPQKRQSNRPKPLLDGQQPSVHWEKGNAVKWRSLLLGHSFGKVHGSFPRHSLPATNHLKHKEIDFDLLI
jgi:hypothetical protein